ncbi:MAG: hypothetical protein EA378_05810 [Phycisphaerales bacterium]|nr:MAG: hypothetical protein EA378_05810 [Phycisphaerales bacterium]
MSPNAGAMSPSQRDDRPVEVPPPVNNHVAHPQANHAAGYGPYNAPGVDVASCWLALAEDSGLCVYVFDLDGRLLHASGSALDAHDILPEDLGHTSLHDILPSPLSNERLELFRNVARSNRPATYESVTRGVRYRATVRPATTPERDRTLVLVTTAPAALHPAERAGVPRELSPNDMGPLRQLTRRELEVLGMIGLGLSTAAIAKRLNRSVKTVEGHRVSLGSKLSVSNRVELARIAIRAGLCEFDPRNHDEPLPPDGD